VKNKLIFTIWLILCIISTRTLEDNKLDDIFVIAIFGFAAYMVIRAISIANKEERQFKQPEITPENGVDSLGNYFKSRGISLD
jgi:hypothetical protein